jgi:hypothetical protein
MASTPQPSVAAFCVSAGRPATVAPAAWVLVPGRSAVEIRVRTAPIFGSVAGSTTTSKINSIGSAIARGEGMATTAALRDHQVQLPVVTATGGYARGIPPRGTPV